MSTNPLTAPLNETERLAAQESERRADLVRAQSEAVRHLEAAKALQGSGGVPWSPTVVLLGALGIVTIPLAFALYAWAFRWFWPEPGIPLVAAALFLTTGLVAGIVAFPSVRGVSLTPLARGLFAAASFLLPASTPTAGIGPQFWLAVVGLTTAACLLTLPRYAIALISHRRADRHLRRADEARQEVARCSADSRGSSPGQVQ